MQRIQTLRILKNLSTVSQLLPIPMEVMGKIGLENFRNPMFFNGQMIRIFRPVRLRIIVFYTKRGQETKTEEISSWGFRGPEATLMTLRGNYFLKRIIQSDPFTHFAFTRKHSRAGFIVSRPESWLVCTRAHRQL